MTKQDLLNIIVPLELSESGMNEIEMMLPPDSNSQVSQDTIKTVVEIIELEDDLDKEFLQKLSDILVGTQTVMSDINTVIDEVNTAVELKEQEAMVQLEDIQSQLDALGQGGSVPQPQQNMPMNQTPNLQQ